MNACCKYSQFNSIFIVSTAATDTQRHYYDKTIKTEQVKKNTAEYTITIYYDNTLVDAQLVDVLNQSAINQLSWLYTCEIQQTNNITTTKYLKKTREYLSTRKGNWTRDTSYDMNEYKE